jgi:trehalose 6-phosphate synthase
VADRRKLIVVSNRGPMSFDRDADGNRVVRRGGGGLVTALRGLVDHHDVTWVASAMTDEDRVVAGEEGEPLEDLPYRLRLLAHDPAAYDRYYNDVANGTLWFLLHYLWGFGSEPDLGPSFRRSWVDGYEAVNRAFAGAVLEELEREPSAAVFLQDYHLFLAPGFVRAERPDVRMTQFVHVPWPQSDYWYALPDDLRRAVHEGLGANDVVGFHTERWRRNFVQSSEALTGTSTATSVHPIGIDPEEFDRLRDSDRVLEEERRIEATRPELLVLRVDRTDPSKNIVRGFRAFALLLEQHPELAGRVGMLALLDPSRQSLASYANYLDEIEREAAAVNERFGRGEWQPVDLQAADNFPQAVAAYKQFDVLFVNAVFDGMNLVAKEAPLVNARGGVVVLSENTGAYAELAEWVVGVNPFDIAGQAAALHEALTMVAAERRRRAAAIDAHVRAHDIGAWTASLLAELDRHTSTITG